VTGFTYLGTFFLGDELDISGTLSQLLTTRAGNRELTPQLLTNLMAELVIPGQGSSMRFFSFPVLSVNSNHVFGDSLLPVWKWVKPDSIYCKTGFWEADLSKALDDGEWNGGKDLVLLTGGVTEETLQIIVAGNRKFTSFGSLSS
jgi:hypothetical protein